MLIDDNKIPEKPFYEGYLRNGGCLNRITKFVCIDCKTIFEVQSSGHARRCSSCKKRFLKMYKARYFQRKGKDAQRARRAELARSSNRLNKGVGDS